MCILETNRSRLVFFKDNTGSIGVSIWSLQCRPFVLGSQSNNPIPFFSSGMNYIFHPILLKTPISSTETSEP
jgi:hypothetical protein